MVLNIFIRKLVLTSRLIPILFWFKNFDSLSALWEPSNLVQPFLLIVCCVSYKFQQNIEKWRLEYFGVFFYLQKTLFCDIKRYFSPVSVYFTGLKMSPSARASKITSRTGLITDIFATVFSTQNLWSLRCLEFTFHFILRNIIRMHSFHSSFSELFSS